MDWNNGRGFFVLAVVVYGISMIYSVFLWRKGFRRDNWVIYSLLVAGLIFHTTAMIKRGLSLNHCPVSNLYEATAFITWTIVGFYAIAGLFHRLRFLGAFASPVLFAVGVFALMPKLDMPHPLSPAPPGTLTSVHAALISLAYGAFGLSFVAAVMYLTQERNLKFHKLQAILSVLPSIQRLELVVGRLLMAGLLLLTAGLAVGAYDLSLLNNPQRFRGDPKIIWSVLVWVMYATLLISRWKFAQSGRRFAIGTIGSFAFVLLTFWGTNVLSTLHNPTP